MDRFRGLVKRRRRSEIDRLESFVKKELGAKGLGWIRINQDGTWQSPIVKFLSDDERQAVAERTGARPGAVNRARR